MDTRMALGDLEQSTKNQSFFKTMEQNQVGVIAAASPEAARLIRKLKEAHMMDY